MSTFSIDPAKLLEENSIPPGGVIMNNVKKLTSGDGSFNIQNGRIELRDANNLIVILLDANG